MVCLRSQSKSIKVNIVEPCSDVESVKVRSQSPRAVKTELGIRIARQGIDIIYTIFKRDISHDVSQCLLMIHKRIDIKFHVSPGARLRGIETSSPGLN